MSSVLHRFAVRVSAVLLALLVLAAVFADLLASEAPLLMSHGGQLTVLPAVTMHAAVRGRSADEIAAGLGPEDWAIWAPLRADGKTRSAAGPLSAPSARHALGTDAEGYDVLGRCIHGCRSVVLTAGAVLLISLCLGLVLGALAGAGPRLCDFLLTRGVELTGMLPTLILLAIVRSIEAVPSAVSLVVVLGALRAMRTARLVRGEALHLNTQPFVMAERALGAPPARVIFRHLVPHACSPLLVCAAFTAASVVALEAALSFVGLGLPSSFPSWGTLLGQAGSGAGANVIVLPALGILLTTGSLYLLAEALDDALSPRRRREIQVLTARKNGSPFASPSNGTTHAVRGLDSSHRTDLRAGGPAQ